MNKNISVVEMNGMFYVCFYAFMMMMCCCCCSVFLLGFSWFLLRFARTLLVKQVRYWNNAHYAEFERKKNT